MRKLLLLGVAAILAAPIAGLAHDPVSAERCADDTVPGAASDCVRVDTDTEFEGGLHVNIDGDDSNPRGDGTSDGYVHVHVSRSGDVTFYCEGNGNYDYENDANNDVCEP